jgi:hypothetical protein
MAVKVTFCLRKVLVSSRGTVVCSLSQTENHTPTYHDTISFPHCVYVFYSFFYALEIHTEHRCKSHRTQTVNTYQADFQTAVRTQALRRRVALTGCVMLRAHVPTPHPFSCFVPAPYPPPSTNLPTAILLMLWHASRKRIV